MARLDILTRVYVYLVATYYSLLFCVQFVLYFVTHPGVAFWRVKDRTIPPRVLTHPEVGTHNYIQLKNIKIHYVEAGDRSKPLMLLTHGYPEFWYSWRHQLKEFSTDYWCVAIDMRGYGDSDKPPKIKDYAITTIVEDIREIVLALGRSTFILVAHDFGGVVGWSFLDLYPEMVSKYVIMNAPHTAAWTHLLKIDKEQLSKSWYVFFYQMPYIPEIYTRMHDLRVFNDIFPFGPKQSKPDPVDLEAYKYTFSKPGALTPPMNYYRNLLTTDATVKKNPDINPPGLFLFGADDRALSVKYAIIMPDFVPNLRSEIIQNAGHFVQQDDPIAVNKAIRKFLAE